MIMSGDKNMKKVLIISGVVLALAIAVAIFFNIKVDNGTYEGGIGTGESDFAGCTETNLLKYIRQIKLKCMIKYSTIK